MTTTHEPNSVDLDGVRDQIDAIKTLNAQIKALTDVRDTLRKDVEIALGDNEIGQLDGHTVATYKFVKSNRLNQRALKEKMPEVWASFAEPSESRRFVVVD